MASLRGTSLRGISVTPTRTALFNISGKKGLDPSIPEDVAQLEAVAKGYAAGAYDDNQLEQFIQENPRTEVFLRPVIAQSQRRKETFGRFFSPGRPAEPFIDEAAQTMGLPQPPGLIAREAEAPRADIQGASLAALQQGDIGTAKELMGLVPKAEKVDSPFAKINPKDYTPESVKVFSQTGDFSALTPRDPDKEDKAPERAFDWEGKLRGEYRNLSKTFIDVRDSYGRILESSNEPSAAGDLSLIFNYMKMLDPKSVVRESEFATAAASGSYGARIQGLVQQALTGKRLEDSVRADFVKRAEALYKRQLSTQKKNEAQYKALSKKYGVDSGRVITDFDLDIKPKKETKTIGGKTYVKINGEWYEESN